MTSNRALLLILSILLATAACGDTPPETQEAFGSENDIRVTYNGDLTLLGSYNELFDKSADTPCVRYADGGSYARVSEPTRHLAIEMVKTKEELARQLGVDLNIKARYAFVSGNAAVNLLDDYSSASNSATYLLEARADYVVRDAVQGDRAIVLSDAALGALESGPNEFVRRCGTHYVNAVRHGARFYVLITFKATSHRAKTKMDASLGLDGSAAASGDIKARLEQTSKLDGIQVKIKTASSGFWLDQQPSDEVLKALESATVDTNLFGATTQLYFAMTEAVQKDYCLDGGEGECGGQQSPGYFNRTRRDTSVTGVQLASYHSLQNVPDASAFGTIKERVDAVNRYLRAYSEIQVRMESIYNDEIGPFFDADEKHKAMYNVAPPGTPQKSPQDLYDVAKGLDELIYPPVGGVMGWLREDVHDKIVSCLDAVNVDVTASCTEGEAFYAPNGEAPPDRELEAEETQAWNELYAFFDEYHNQKRILPLSVAIGMKGVSFADAPDHCEYLARELNDQLEEVGSPTKVVYRLPTREEAIRLAPMVSHGNVQWSSASLQHAIWYQPAQGDNPCTDGHPYYKNEPGTEPSFGCASDSWTDLFEEDLVPLCVPASGPTPLLPPK